jgi:integrase/recombinase XerD
MFSSDLFLSYDKAVVIIFLCRPWFTTHLRSVGISREFIHELRGDARRKVIDIYDHIDLEELKEAYLANIPQLGI